MARVLPDRLCFQDLLFFLFHSGIWNIKGNEKNVVFLQENLLCKPRVCVLACRSLIMPTAQEAMLVKEFYCLFALQPGGDCTWYVFLYMALLYKRVP